MTGNNRKRLLVLGSVLILECAVWFFLPLLTSGKSDDKANSTPADKSSSREATSSATFQVITRQPETPTVLTGKIKADGTPETVSCRTCHDTQQPTPSRNNAGTLQDFHQGLTYQHGQLACLSSDERKKKQKRKYLKKVLKKLKKHETTLKETLESEPDESARAKLERESELAPAQRKKGLKNLEGLKKKAK